MSEITKDKLWRLYELCLAKGVETIELDIATPGEHSKVGLFHGKWKHFSSVDSAIDYLDPPKSPTADEWRAAWAEWENANAINDIYVRRNILRELAERHDRAKAARRDERSMFDLGSGLNTLSAGCSES